MDKQQKGRNGHGSVCVKKQPEFNKEEVNNFKANFKKAMRSGLTVGQTENE